MAALGGDDEIAAVFGCPNAPMVVDAFTPKECANYFTACGYDAD